MPTRRELAEAQAYRRHLASAALRGGEPGLRRADVPDHPNRGIYAGIVLAIVGLVAAAAHGYLAGAPAGWRKDGSLVIDRQYGGRYLVRGGELHPVPNLTSLLLLTGGRPPSAVTVDHAELRTARIGSQLGLSDIPEQPPVVRSTDDVTACAAGGRITLLIGPLSGTRLHNPAVLIRGPAARRFGLVTGDTVYPITRKAITALGYSAAEAITTPSPWPFLMRHIGPPLGLLSPPGLLRRGVTPANATRTVGAVIEDDRTGATYVVSRTGLRPVLNRTSRLLLAAQHPPVRVPHARIVASKTGAAFGLAGVPPSPPSVPVAGSPATACVPTTGSLQLYRTTPVPPADQRQQPAGATARRRPRGVSLEAPPGHGALFAVPPKATRGQPAPTTQAPTLWLVSGGREYRLADEQVASALHYDPRHALRVPAAWLSLLPHGPTLPDLVQG